MATLKLILLTSVFNLSQIPFEDRIVREDHDSGKEMVVKGESGEINRSVGNVLYADSMIVYDEFSLKAKWDDRAYLRNLTGLFPERYVASISIDGLLRSAPAGKYSPGKNGQILIGIKKPYYRFDRYFLVRGKVDLQMGGSIFGLENKGLISVAYDLRGKNIYRGVSTSVSFDSVIYRIVIQFGPK
ncbi:MAG: hypothetical protein JSW64_04735 [Candidatus Zixiibacteriota bacterium]|nr:MAG: hypothetical protein JSW64_04735 [candidate division Zixibacteria bacterium]